jgi:hypothetical protein
MVIPTKGQTLETLKKKLEEEKRSRRTHNNTPLLDIDVHVVVGHQQHNTRGNIF